MKVSVRAPGNPMQPGRRLREMLECKLRSVPGLLAVTRGKSQNLPVLNPECA